MKTILWTFLFLLSACPLSLAELTVVEEKTDDGTLTIFRMKVTAAPEPTPALKHRLRLRPHEYKPGNAATHYLRANSENGLATAIKATRKKYGDDYYDWGGIKLATRDLPLDRMREASAWFDSHIENFIRPASERADCDWGFHLAELSGSEVYSFLLPEVQESRALSMLLAMRTRLATAEGRYDDAIDHMRMNYRLAENVGRPPLLVCGLVGIAGQGGANKTVIDLIAAPDSPNLYWALTEIPRPLIDMRNAIGLEMTIAPRVFSALDKAETAEHSPAEWTRLIVEDLKLAGELGLFSTGPDTVRALKATGLGLVMYPDAKRRLLRSGMDSTRVEQMPVGQVLAIDAGREYRRIADATEKWAYVPFPEARYSQDESNKLSIGAIIANSLMPTVRAAHQAQIRQQWQADAIRVVEALRMHATEAGQFPVSLDDVRVVPVPQNPITRQPYIYRRKNLRKTAVLELPFSDGMPGVAWRFELELIETKKSL